MSTPAHWYTWSTEAGRLAPGKGGKKKKRAALISSETSPRCPFLCSPILRLWRYREQLYQPSLYSIYFMPDSTWRALYVWMHLIFTTTLWVDIINPNFSHEEQAPRGEVTCQRSHEPGIWSQKFSSWLYSSYPIAPQCLFLSIIFLRISLVFFHSTTHGRGINNF